jgi:hypothetical protein
MDYVYRISIVSLGALINNLKIVTNTQQHMKLL